MDEVILYNIILFDPLHQSFSKFPAYFLRFFSNVMQFLSKIKESYKQNPQSYASVDQLLPELAFSSPFNLIRINDLNIINQELNKKIEKLEKVKKQKKNQQFQQGSKILKERDQKLEIFNKQLEVLRKKLDISCHDKKAYLIDQQNYALLNQYKEYFKKSKTIEEFKQKSRKVKQFKHRYCLGNLFQDSVYPLFCKCQKCCDDDVCGNWSNCFRCIMCCSWHFLMCSTCTCISLPYCICQRSQYCTDNVCPFFYKDSTINYSRQKQGQNQESKQGSNQNENENQSYKCYQVCCQPSFDGINHLQQCFCYNGCLFFEKFRNKIPTCLYQSLCNIVQCPKAMLCNTSGFFLNIGRNIGNFCMTACCRKKKVLLDLGEIYKRYEKQIFQDVKR